MLRATLSRLIRIGCLTVTGPGKQSFTVGAPAPEHPTWDVAVRLRGRLTPYKLALDPDRYLGQAYMDGDLTIERGTLWDLLDLAGANLALNADHVDGLLAGAVRRVLSAVQQHNSRRSSRHNVAHHYDLSEQLYRLFLDQDMQYSCAYFRSTTDSLDEAQLAKRRHIAAKLRLRPGLKVLDIGCGWGGLALFLAQTADIQVLGVTLSREQLAVARRRAHELGLEDRVRFELIDYRDITETFDRVVSVGMFEHVGSPQYETFFVTMHKLLKPQGVALLHSIGRRSGPSWTSSWIRKYIFPGGYVPALSEVLPAIEHNGLWVTDIEILRLHYAETLRRWRERFLQRQHELAPTHDERFRRMWEFYLAISEMSFRHGGFMVFQAQLTRDIGAVPITRDYMHDAERALSRGRGVNIEMVREAPRPPRRESAA